MPLEFLGIDKNKEDKERLITGLWTLDHAFYDQEKREYGFPLGVGVEVYGAEGIGKSTFVYSLAGIIAAALKGNIVLADLETFSPTFLKAVLTSVGMTDGKVHLINEKTQADHESVLEELLSLMKEKDNVVGILDSVGAVIPLSEMEGEFGEANMGKRAKLMAQYSRRATQFIKFYQPMTLFMTNHMHSAFSGYGVTTPGGIVKNYLNTIRIHVRRKETFDDGSYVLEGKVKKNRWGVEDRHFFVTILSGHGIHFGLSAMVDGMMIGKVKRGRTVKIGGESYGYLKDTFKKAREGDEEFFQPFFDALRNSGKNGDRDSISEDNEVDDNSTD